MLYNEQVHLKSVFGKLIGERKRIDISTGDKTIKNIYKVEDNKLSKYCMDFHKSEESEVYLWPTDQK